MQKFGFLNIYKERNVSSHDVIYRLRKISGIKKIGHAGTLDPLATGVLPVAVGGATRLIEYLNDDKKYVATLKFGETSTTYDDEGEKTPCAMRAFSRADFKNILPQFIGKISQIPPIYSAIKVGGKKLYEYARNNQEVQIKPREVEIYDIEILDFALPYATIKVSCASGTYIRSLAHDIGMALNVGAYLSALERVEFGNFKIENAKKLDSICTHDAFGSDLISPNEILNFKTYELNEEEFLRVNNGNSIVARDFCANLPVFLTYQKNIVAISTLCDNILKVEKVLR